MKEPQRRYTTAAALAKDLQRFLAGKPILARSVGPVARAWRWCQRRPTVAALVTGLFLAVGVGFFGMTALWLRADRRG